MEKKHSYQIFVKGLRLAIRLGCRPEERKDAQAVQLDLVFNVDLATIATDVSETVCYLSAADIAVQHAARQEWALIEDYLESLTKEFFSSFPACSQVESSLTKFVVPTCEGAGVKITRQRF